MPLARRISDHRPKVVLTLLVVLSLASLASGARGGLLSEGTRTVVGVASMPILIAFERAEASFDYLTGLVLRYSEMNAQTGEMLLRITELNERVAAGNEMRAENDRLRTMLAFQRYHSQYTLMPAEVIQHSNGVLTLDRGSLHGIRESMCVISPEGIIGLVTRLGPLTASVATLQNPECRIDAIVKWNRVRGRVYGSGNELSAMCTMHYIDLKDQVREGDEIVASPDSIFPSGYPIGRIIGVPERGQLSQSADILPAADPFRVDEVFVLLSASRDWRELSGRMEARTQFPEDTGLIDINTIQERLAP